MFVSIVLNMEYMDIASRTKWYLKCLRHCIDNGWILITHEYMRTHIEDLQKEITSSLFESWEMQPFKFTDIENVEQYFIPDFFFDNAEKQYGSRSEMLFAMNNENNATLTNYLLHFIDEITKKHPNERIDGIFNVLECFESIRVVAQKLNIPLFNYSFSALRKPHGYRQTLYHVNRERLWNSMECSERWHKFSTEKIPIFTNKEIIAILGKERTLPLLRLMNSTPKYEMGVCCECYSLLPPVFAKHQYTDDDIFYECSKLYTKDKIKVRSHSLHLDEIQVDRTEVRNDPAAFILSCKRLTAVQSQILLKVLLWNRTAVMKKDTLAFSYLCSKDYAAIMPADIEGLNYYIFGYLIPSELMFSDKYWKWRLTNPSETDIYMYHLTFLLEALNIDKEMIMVLQGEDRLKYLLECRGCDGQLIEDLLKDDIIDNVNWNVASTRFDIKSQKGVKTFWRINTENADGSLCTKLSIDVDNAQTIIFYPLDDVAGFAKINTMKINGKAILFDKYLTQFQYLPKTKGCFEIKIESSITGHLEVECVWNYQCVNEYLKQINQ